ncbi:MAG: SnoaL-like domain-containing protein [Ginsengibacter sp.]
MHMLKTIENFIAMVEANKHIEAVEHFYVVNATLKDNQSTETRGKERRIENEKKLLSTIKKMHSKCVQPYFVKDNNVVIKWQFRFEFKNDTSIDIEEIAYQQWNNGQIENEQFFFDPKQLIPKPIS